MNPTLVFTLVSIIYITLLAVLDGVFNRLVFRENRKLSYFSETKQKIYKLPEWRYIGLILLIILPIALPFIVIIILLGVKYFMLYLFILMIVPWDNIFGKIVFDDWFGDTPSIALPVIGWKHFKLKTTILFRVIMTMTLAVIYFLV